MSKQEPKITAKERPYMMRHLPTSLHDALEELAFATRDTKENVVVQALTLGMSVLRKRVKPIQVQQ